MLFFLLLFFSAACSLNAESGAVLQAIVTVSAIPHRTDTGENFGKIQPGTQLKLVVTVQNVGTEPNVPGKMFVRFMFPEPLSSQPQSLLFQTETMAVPSITPGQEVSLTFPSGHNWPSLFDFIRYDWGMRQFQAVFVEEEKEHVLGTLSMLFSAYYYQGPNKEIPTTVTVQKPDIAKKPTLTRAGERNALSRRLVVNKKQAAKEGAKEVAKGPAAPVKKELAKGPATKAK